MGLRLVWIGHATKSVGGAYDSSEVSTPKA